MIRQQRKIHRIAWLVLAPLLLGLILVFNRPHTDYSPPNTDLVELPGSAPHTSRGKGALP